MELSCTRETSGWQKEKLPEWSSCTPGAGAGPHRILDRQTALKSFLALGPARTSFWFYEKSNLIVIFVTARQSFLLEMG